MNLCSVVLLPTWRSESDLRGCYVLKTNVNLKKLQKVQVCFEAEILTDLTETLLPIGPEETNPIPLLS